MGPRHSATRSLLRTSARRVPHYQFFSHAAHAKSFVSIFSGSSQFLTYRPRLRAVRRTRVP
eukprot:249820-Prymnesium_polylepis.1